MLVALSPPPPAPRIWWWWRIPVGTLGSLWEKRKRSSPPKAALSVRWGSCRTQTGVRSGFIVTRFLPLFYTVLEKEAPGADGWSGEQRQQPGRECAPLRSSALGNGGSDGRPRGWAPCRKRRRRRDWEEVILTPGWPAWITRLPAATLSGTLSREDKRQNVTQAAFVCLPGSEKSFGCLLRGGGRRQWRRKPSRRRTARSSAPSRSSPPPAPRHQQWPPSPACVFCVRGSLLDGHLKTCWAATPPETPPRSLPLSVRACVKRAGLPEQLIVAFPPRPQASPRKHFAPLRWG